MDYRPYEHEQDLEAVMRIMGEIGWLEDTEEDMRIFLQSGQGLVAELDGAPECSVMTVGGRLRYLEEQLPFSCVGMVATSRIARRQGLAAGLSAQAVARSAMDGAVVSGLGMFDQGFYDRLGFGTGGYDLYTRFDPRNLKVDVTGRVPGRLGVDDWEAIHAARMNWPRGHGAVTITPALYTRAELLHSKNGFGLGYCDGPNGELTHHVWFHAKALEWGPYGVDWMVWNTHEQFLELMGVIKSFADQVYTVGMREPQGVQLQDLLDQPFRRRRIGEKGKFETHTQGSAWWQMRILDLAACLEQTHLPGPEVRFNLTLTDPIEAFLSGDELWRGVAGTYVITLGPDSRAEPGRDDALPEMKAGVGAFTRLWLGVLPASGLALTGGLTAPAPLIDRLEAMLRLPPPQPGWDF